MIPKFSPKYIWSLTRHTSEYSFVREKCWLLEEHCIISASTKFLFRYCRALVSTSATGAAEPVDFGYWVHSPVNFQAPSFFHTSLSDFTANGQILHPWFKIYNKGTVLYITNFQTTDLGVKKFFFFDQKWIFR